MKKICFLGLFLVASSFMANAQLFVGGNIGFTSEGGSTEANGTSTDKPTKSSFVFSPKGGYYLTEDFAFGAQLSLGTAKTKTTIAGAESTQKSNSFIFAPFARYHAVRVDKFSFFMEGELGIGAGSSKNEAAGISVDGPKTSSFHIALTPGLAYEITDRIQLETSLNFLGLGYYSNKSKTGSGNSEVVDTNTNFEFGANLDNIATIGTIRVGAIFKF